MSERESLATTRLGHYAVVLEVTHAWRDAAQMHAAQETIAARLGGLHDNDDAHVSVDVLGVMLTRYGCFADEGGALAGLLGSMCAAASAGLGRPPLLGANASVRVDALS